MAHDWPQLGHELLHGEVGAKARLYAKLVNPQKELSGAATDQQQVGLSMASLALRT